MILDYEETLMRQGFNFINPELDQVLRLWLLVFRMTYSADDRS